MDQLAKCLQAVGYHAALLQPLLPMYIHLIISALFPIYTGAHASLSRPSSAAKPEKKQKRHDEDDEPEEKAQKMEGLSPSDAILLPVFAGLSLTWLYFLIKWLEDPAVLNKVLTWYFSVFGVLSLSRLLHDGMIVIHSFVFPTAYVSNGRFWKVNGKSKKAKSLSTDPKDGIGWEERDSPLPGSLSTFPFPALEKGILWALRDFPTQKIRIRAYIHGVVNGDFKIGAFGITAISLAMAAQLYFNLVEKPWWLTNLLGFSGAYSILQIMTPTTSWTGTLILGGLFIYDIYFVFFTPLMVTVATKIDIPAKLIFPRTGGKPGMSMLGLGDVVLPGMMIGFALRFDLYLHYLRKQTQKAIDKVADTKVSEDQQQQGGKSQGKPAKNTATVKAKWLQATGNWGDRYWTEDPEIESPESLQGGIFPKTYFHASIIGYVVGMVFTLLVMQVFGHAQPALLYLVPSTLGSLWGTALVKGDIKTLWHYTEAEDEMEEETERKAKAKDDDGTNEKKGVWAVGHWIKDFFQDMVGSTPIEEPTSNGAPEDTKKHSKSRKVDDNSQNLKGFARHRKSELLFFSVNLPQDSSTQASDNTISAGTGLKAPARQQRRAEKLSHLSTESSDDQVPKSQDAQAMRNKITRRHGGLGETH